MSSKSSSPKPGWPNDSNSSIFVLPQMLTKRPWIVLQDTGLAGLASLSSWGANWRRRRRRWKEKLEMVPHLYLNSLVGSNHLSKYEQHTKQCPLWKFYGEHVLSRFGSVASTTKRISMCTGEVESTRRKFERFLDGHLKDLKRYKSNVAMQPCIFVLKRLAWQGQCCPSGPLGTKSLKFSSKIVKTM